MNHKWSNGVKISDLSDAHINNILRKWKVEDNLEILPREHKEHLVYQISMGMLEDDYDYRESIR